MNSLFGGKGGRVPPPTRKLVIRKANSQRDLRPISERLSLDKVLGITASSNACLACNPVDGIVAYPAGCVVVLFNPRRNKQDFIHNVSRKSITAVSFSRDGKFLATGESGHMPSVRVWILEDPSHPQTSEMKKGHKHGVSCVAFSPNLKFLVSVGYQHDMLINVWNWRDGSKVACNKFSTKVYAISFSEIGNFFVTSGVRHVKFWYFDTESTKLKHDKTLPIKGRSGILGELRSHTFCDVACGLGENSEYTYCVTTAGALCSFNSKRNLEKYVELGSSKALSMAISEKYIICGYTNGFIRVFEPSTLLFVATLPKPHFLGVNVSDGIDPSHMIDKTNNATYADTIALALDSNNHRITCVYNDHSIYIWDLKDIKKVGKIWSSLYHSGCIWGLEIYPEVPNPTDNKEAPLPPGTFLTCSNDDTVRVWNVTEGTNISTVKNIYSKELLRILYMDKTFASLKNNEISPTSKNVRDATTDGKNGVRTIRTSPDGQHLAVGERSGNVRVYDCMFLDEILKIDAHESEVLCIEFSPPESGYKLLASAGRDRLIHIFDVKREFTLIQTLDDHSASITSVKFNVDDNNDFQLLSCGADKSIIFRSAQYNPDLQFVRNTNYVGKTTLYDMAIDSSRNVAAIACQDRNVRVYDTSTGKQTKCYKGAQGDDGTLVKITMDKSGYYTATSCSDKTLSLHEFDTEECMATMSGHSEIVTGIRFTNNLTKLITVSGDGCIFIWSIPMTYTQNMRERLSEIGQELPREIQPETPLRRGTYRIEHNSVIVEDTNAFGSPSSDFLSGRLELDPPVADYRFSIGQLPSWAKKQIIAEGGSSQVTPRDQDSGGPSHPGGRWAQRVNDGELQVVSETSPQRPITLALDLSAPERKKFSTGYDSFQEQVNALANSPLERKCSLTNGEDEDLFPVNGKLQLDELKEEDSEVQMKAGDMPQGVTLSRGSDAFSRPRTWTGDKLLVIETEEIQFEEAEESKEDDVKESIIYFPPAQDDMETETARSFQVTAAQKPQRRSVGDTQELEEKKEKVDNKRKMEDESSSEEDDDPLSVLDDMKTDDAEDEIVASDKFENHDDDDEDVDEKCRKYFDCLGSTPTKEEPEEQIATPVAHIAKPESTLPFLNGRLSISARFLSRSLLTSTRATGQQNMEILSEEDEAQKARTTSLEEHKLEIQRRKEEMARAVDANRKRLSALRKAKEERELRNASPQDPTTSAVSSSVTMTLNLSPRRISTESEPKPIVPSKDLSVRDLGAAPQQQRSLSSPFTVPVSSQNVSHTETHTQENNIDLISTTTTKTTSTNLFETCLSTVSVTRTNKDQLIPEKDENVWIKRNSSDITRGVEDEPTSDPVKLPKDKGADENTIRDAQIIIRSEVAQDNYSCKVLKEKENSGVKEETKEQKEQITKPSEMESEQTGKREMEIEKEKEREREKEKASENEDTKQQEKANIDVELKEKTSKKERPDEKEKERKGEKEKESKEDKKESKKEDKKEDNKDKKEDNKDKKEDNKDKREDIKDKREDNKDKKEDNKDKKEDNKDKKEDNKDKKEDNKDKKEDSKDKKEDSKDKKEDSKDKKEDNKDKKEKGKTDSSSVGKLEKRGSSSSLMAQTKSSWRRSLGFSGFSKHKDKKEERRGSSTSFASTLRSSDQPVPGKKSEKILFRDKRGKVSAEERRSKSKSLGDLDARLKPLKEVLILDPSVPPSHVVSTADIPSGVTKTKDVDKPSTSSTSPPPFADRRSPIGKDKDEKSASKLQLYQDAVNQLTQAFKSISDLHSQVLEDDSCEDKDHILSLLTNTYSNMEEQCKVQRLNASQAFKSSNPSKSLSSSLSYSTSNIDSLRPSGSTGKMNRFTSEACLPSAVHEQEDMSRELLMKYSDILVEMVKEKLSN